MKTKIAALIGAGLIGASVQAGTVTPIGDPGLPSQEDHSGIFADLFGGVFVQTGNDFSNGIVDVTRVSDDDDQTYDFLQWEAHVVATWALASQSFGTIEDGVIFDVQGDDNVVSGQTLGNVGGTGIEFGRFGSDFNMIDVSTNPASNPGGKDHVVTYTWSVNGVEAENRYLLFFEDSNETSDFTDIDFNDMVVEISGTPVPEPTSLALIGLGGLAMLRRRR